MQKIFRKTLIYYLLISNLYYLPAATLEPTATMRTETILMVQLLEQLHYLQKKLGSIPNDKIIQNYMNVLDPQKMFFFDKQVKDFTQKYQLSLELLWRGGSLNPGFEIFNTYQKNLQHRIDWIQSRLDKTFDFKTQNNYKYERKDLNWASNLFVLDQEWDQRLQHEMLNEMLCTSTSDLEDSSNNNLKEINEEKALMNEPKARENLKNRYKNIAKLYQRLEAIDVQELYSNALTQYYDPHTTFFSADSMEDFSISLWNSLVGIGACLSEDKGTCTIKEILPGGPAEHSQQLHAGDKILAVAQGKKDFVNIEGMKLRNSVKLIRGPKGTLVRLLIQPADSEPSDRRIVELFRDEIKLENNLASAKIFYIKDANNAFRRIGLIDLPTFYGQETPDKTSEHSLTNDVRSLIEQMKLYNIEGIILDMRRNGGGLLTEAINLSGLFLNQCPVVQVKDSTNQIVYQYSPNNTCIWTGPLLILTSRFSASASEIVAGALQCQHRALIFGSKTTHGKGTVQVILEMDKLSTISKFYAKLGALKITLQKWYLPNGQSTQLRGVPSDIYLKSIYDCLPIGEADLPNALAWDRVKPMPSMPTNSDACQLVTPGLIQYLTYKQHQRQKTLPMYTWYENQVNWFAKKYEQTEISLNLNTRIKNINDERTFRQKIKEEGKDLISYRNFYKPLGLKDLQTIKTENSDVFDLFEYEALNLMADWLLCNGQQRFELIKWTYVALIKNNFQFLL